MKMEKYFIPLLCIAALLVVTVAGSKMQMPSFVTSGEKVKIECKLDREQSIIEHFKWYKDNQLFYMVVPGKDPETTKMDLQGVPLNVEESKMDEIVLNSVSEETSGLYTCELKLEDRMVRMSGTLVVYPAKE